MILREARIVYSGKRIDGARQIRSAEDVFRVCKDLSYETQEHFVVLHLDAKNNVLSRQTIGVGSVNEVATHPREIFRGAIFAGAVSIIIVHNHPSGDPTPSRADLEITSRLGQAGELLGIPVSDHVIIGENYCSIRATIEAAL